jgi:hypothetical protein
MPDPDTLTPPRAVNAHSTGSAMASSSSANQSSQNVYGYFVVQTTSGILLWAERFSDGPYPIANNGDQIKVTPRFELA